MSEPRYLPWGPEGAQDAIVEVTAGASVTLTKPYGPWAVRDLRVRLDYEKNARVIQAEHLNDAEWSVVAEVGANFPEWDVETGCPHGEGWGCRACAEGLD